MNVEDKVLMDMSNVLDAEQLDKLRDVLLINLYSDEGLDENLSDEEKNEQLLMMYFANLKLGGRSKNTIDRYELELRMLNKFFNNKDFCTYTANDMKYYLAWYKENRKVSNTTLENMRITFVTFWAWLEIEDFIDKNPMRKIAPIKKDTQNEKAFTSDEIEILKNAVNNPRDKAIITFLASTCCRVSELCSANIDDVDFLKREVVIHGKGNKDRVVYLDDVSNYYLKEYLKSRNDDNKALFVKNKGNPERVKKNSIERLFARLGQKTGIENVHPHRFRSSQITNLLRRGMPIQLVQNLAGHEHINTTEKYNKLDRTLVKNEFMRLS